MKLLKDKIKHHFHEVLKTKTSPSSLALGFAIGTLIAILPTPGFSFLLGLLIVLIFKRVSKYALFLALVVFNPIVQIPIYALSYKIGDSLFGSVPVVKYNVDLLNQAYNFTRRFLIGNVIMAILLSIAGYFLTYFLVKFFRKKHLIM